MLLPEIFAEVMASTLSRDGDDSQRARDSSGRLRRTGVAATAVSVFLTLNLAPTVAGASDYKYGAPANGFSTSTSCPWVAQSRHRGISDVALANEVIRRMTLAERVSFVVLSTYPPLENQNVGVPSLCIPPLSLSDGPMGLANGLTGVTAFPAELGLARASTLRSCATWAKRLATRPAPRGSR